MTQAYNIRMIFYGTLEKRKGSRQLLSKRNYTQMDFKNPTYSQQKHELHIQKDVLSFMLIIVDCLSEDYKKIRPCSGIETSMVKDCLHSLNKKIAKYLDGLDREENQKVCWEKRIDAIKQLEHELSMVLVICNSIDRAFGKLEGKCEANLKLLEIKMDVLREVDKVKKAGTMENLQKTLEHIQGQMQQITELVKSCMEGTKLPKKEEKKQHQDAIVQFRKKLSEFNEEEIGETIIEQMQRLTQLVKLEGDNMEGNKICKSKDKKQQMPIGAENFQTLILKQMQVLSKIMEPDEDNSVYGDTDFANDDNRPEKTTEAKGFLDMEQLKRNAILHHFRRKLNRFRKSLSEGEIGDSIYFLENRKACWEKQMDEIKQLEHEMTTVYLLGNVIDNGFDDIDTIYVSKLEELNEKINIFKEKEKVKQTETIAKLHTEALEKLLKKAETKMQYETQIRQPIRDSGNWRIMGNILLERIRSKIVKLRKNIVCQGYCYDNLYSAESTKAFWEQQMDEIKQLELELTTVYLRGNEIDKEFEAIESDYDANLWHLNRTIGELRERS